MVIASCQSWHKVRSEWRSSLNNFIFLAAHEVHWSIDWDFWVIYELRNAKHLYKSLMRDRAIDITQLSSLANSVSDVWPTYIKRVSVQNALHLNLFAKEIA